ncbi:MAG: hypothetical protein FJ284_02255 [Planctomycetes bacterium]|nr:hypothetical protein [Planctomycetota bacterium]
MASTLVDPAWRTLDLVERSQKLIHATVRTTQPGTEPPVLEAARIALQELHLIFTSRRWLGGLATGLLRGLPRH